MRMATRGYGPPSGRSACLPSILICFPCFRIIVLKAESMAGAPGFVNLYCGIGPNLFDQPGFPAPAGTVAFELPSVVDQSSINKPPVAGSSGEPIAGKRKSGSLDPKES